MVNVHMKKNRIKVLDSIISKRVTTTIPLNDLHAGVGAGANTNGANKIGYGYDFGADLNTTWGLPLMS